MNLSIALVVAGKQDGHPWRYPQQAIPILEDIVGDNYRSDIILFPGGFVYAENNRDYTKKRILKAMRGFEGMLITGFDKEKQETPLIISEGKCHTFNQASRKGKDIVNDKYARENRFFNYKGTSIGVVSCGEIFSKQFRQIMFKDKIPEILFGCVHYGENFQNEPYRARLNQYSKSASFYTFHTNNNDEESLVESKFSGAVITHVKHHPTINMGVINYDMTTILKYNIPVTRKIRRD